MIIVEFLPTYMKNIVLDYNGSAKANGREPKSCLGRVFNFKFGCFVMCTVACPIQARPSLELKTRPRFRPVSLSLTMTTIKVQPGQWHSGRTFTSSSQSLGFEPSH